jgi:hypothetical protein
MGGTEVTQAAKIPGVCHIFDNSCVAGIAEIAQYRIENASSEARGLRNWFPHVRNPVEAMRISSEA